MRAEAAGLLGAAVTVLTPVKLAMDFESSMADVRKVVDFDTPQQFKEMQQDILNLTHRIPMAGRELAAIAASGGQLGIARQDIAGFTETVAKMSVAFDMSAEQAGDSMAKLANVYQIPIAQIDRLGDAINHLSNSSPAKASDIVNTLGRVGGVAKQFGLTELQAASLSNTFISLGKAPEVAGTAINGMLTKLMTADKQGKDFQNALKGMGLSAEQLKRDIARNGEGALVDFLKRVNSLPKEMQMGTLVDLFGLQYADDIAVLTGSVETYERSIRQLKETAANGEMAFLGSMDKEFQSRMSTTAAQWQTFKNQIMHLGIAIGSVLLPAVNEALNSIKPMVDGFIRFSETHPGLIRNIFLGIAAFAAFKAGSLGVRFGLNIFSTALLGLGGNILSVRGNWLRLQAAFGLLKIGGVGRATSALQILGLSTRQARQGVVWFGRLMRGLTNGIGRISVLGSRFLIVASRVRGLGTAANWLLGIWRTLSMAALTNPLGLAIAGIAVAAVLIYKYWGPIKSFFIGLWDGFKDGVAPMMPVLEMIAFGWQQIWEVVSGFFSDFMGSSSEASDSAQGFGYIVGHVLGNILSIGFTIVDGWRMIFDLLFSTVDSVWTEIKTAFNGGLTGILGLILNWSPIGAFHSAFAAVLSWFGIELPAKFTEFGSNIISGLWNGLKARFEEVKAWFSGVAGWFAAKFQNSNEIKSPSRLFKRFGGWMMEGLQIGLGNGSARPLAAIGAVASDLQQRFKNRSGTLTLSAELAASMQAHSAEFAAARQAPAGGGVTIHFNPTIHAPGGDVQQIQAALQMGLREFEDLFNRLMDERARRAY
ncbi:phage tail tape measure protein [Neisseria shayeganii]|nr:phage tail tape measure protein [Neisseria shayeganii]